MALTGCSQIPAVPEQAQPQWSIGGALANPNAPSKDWFDSRIHLSASDRLNYEVGYAIEGGDLLPRIDDKSTLAPLTQVPLQLGGGTFSQSLATSLPGLAGARPDLKLSRLSGSRWNPAGPVLRREQQAQLSWKPAPLALQLQWATPRWDVDPFKPLDCHRNGDMRIALDTQSTSPQALNLGASACSVLVPARLANGVTVDRWSGAWDFGRPGRSQQLSFTAMETPTSPLPAIDPAAGYELRYMRARASGAWAGDSAVGLRKVSDARNGDIRTWTSPASLSRQLSDIAVTAAWQHDADPLWFIPGVASPVDQLSLGLDLKSWLKRQWGLAKVVDANLRYQWNQSADPALDGGALFWNLSKTW